MKTQPSILTLSIGIMLALFATAMSAVPEMLHHQGRVAVNGVNFNGSGKFKFALVDGGTQTTATLATATANVVSGFVVGYTVTNGGSGYTTAPAVTITAASGSGATATATIAAGVVTAITPVNAGSGYPASITVTLAAPSASLTYITYWSNNGSSAAGSEPSAEVTLPVTQGLYSVLLGDTGLPNMVAIPATVFNNSDVRLRVWFNDGVHGFDLLTPDQRLVAAGYALVAATIPDALVTTAKLADGAVTGAKLAPEAVQSGSVANEAIGTSQLGNGAVTTAKIARGAVGSTEISDDAITSAHIAANAVVTSGIAADAVTSAKIANGAVGSSQIASAAVQAENIANAAIGTSQLADGSVTTAKLGSGSVQTAAIGDGQVVGSKIATGAITGTQLAGNSVQTIHITAGAVSTAQLESASITGTKIAANTIDATKLSFTPLMVETDPKVTISDSNSIPRWNGSSLVNGTLFDNGNIGIGTTNPSAKLDINGTVAINGTTIIDASRNWVGNPISPSGSAGGALTGSYPNPALASNAVTSTKLADLSVTSAKVADAAISSSKIATQAVQTANIADASVTAQKLSADILSGGVQQVIRGVVNFGAKTPEVTQSFSPNVDPTKSYVLVGTVVFKSNSGLSPSRTYFGATLIALTDNTITLAVDAPFSAGADIFPCRVSYQIIQSK